MTRGEGRSGTEMIRDSLLYGVDRYTSRTDKKVAAIDRFLGIDPQIARNQRKERMAARATLQKIAGWDTPLPKAAAYATSLKNLSQHGFIERRKSKKGFKITKKGRTKVKEMGGSILDKLLFYK